MSLKDYFNNKQPIQQIISSASANDIGLEVESAEAIEEEIKNKNRFEPHVDFSKPENFARFGSAEQYYAESIKRIYKTYPYDGSLKEKTQWRNSSSFFDKYIYDTVYPKTTGYAIFSPDGWGSQASSVDEGYGEPSTKEYILIKGGPNADPDNTKLQDIFPSSNGKANIYDFSENRESNLKIGGEDGNTIEFWLYKNPFDVTKTKKEVVFDLWTTGTLTSSTDYGRLTIELSGHGVATAADTSPFYVTYMSGTYGFTSASIGKSLTTSSIVDSSWHHYAFTFQQTGSGADDGQTVARLYIDGALNDEITTGTTASYVSGNLHATIGSLFWAPSGSNISLPASGFLGFGKLSGSIDEFRFWKKARNPKEIGRHWFTEVHGGTNTDGSNTQLGVYYKFNEGITATSSIDSIALDYSGRLSSGSWTGYTSTSRNTGSAIVSASAANHENLDPIVYYHHPAVSGALDTYSKSGRIYDYTNNASIYNGIPEWIRSEDQESGQHLLKLTQIMSSYFDSLALQAKALPTLKNASYTPFSASYETTSSVSTGSHSYKPLPFANRLVESMGLMTSEIFIDADVISQFAARDEKIIFKDKIYNTKNLIYQNLYNNLVHLYKSKGTEKAFRNAIRCYGIDDELIKVNVYANNITYELKDGYNHTIRKKNYIDFNHGARFAATVFQQTASSNSNSVSFISGSEELLSGTAITLEAEVIFPEQFKGANATDGDYTYFPSLSSSLFGFHTAISSKASAQSVQTDTTWTRSGSATVTVVNNQAADYDNRTLVITNTAGTTKTYTFDGYSSFNASNVPTIGISGDSTTGIATNIKTAIEHANGHNGTISVSRDALVLTLNQQLAGDSGNNTITKTIADGQITVSGFAGGISDKPIEIYAIRDDFNSENVYFQCTSSLLQINLTSSVFYDVYDDEKWNFAVRIRPSTFPMADKVSGSADRYIHGSGTVEFCGYNATQNYIKNQFSVTQSVLLGNKINHLVGSPKRVYAGAQRTNFTGTVKQLTDVKISSVRYWFDYLSDETIMAHAKDATNVGVLSPYQHAYLMTGSNQLLNHFIPRIDTLALNWDFAKITGSNSDGEFVVDDASSGSTAATGQYGDIGNLIKIQHTATGYGFPASNAKVVDRNFVPVAKQRLPESVASSDMIEIRSQDDINFTRETRPITHFISVEKSMYQTISEEMLKMFATIKDFNSLIGEPVNRYRPTYKRMDKLRQLFFERVEEVSDLDRYIDFYKWLDSSIDMLIEQFFPMSSDATDSVRNMIESHVLERNKYWTKFPTLDSKQSDPEAHLLGINELLYPWKEGHAPPAPSDGGSATVTVVNNQAADYDNRTLVITNTAGTTKTYTFDGYSSFNASNVPTIGISGDSTTGIATNIKTAIEHANGHNGTISVSRDALVLTLNQQLAGDSGNNTITKTIADGQITVSGFAGGRGTAVTQADNCLWWKDRAVRTDNIAGLSSSVNNVDEDRETIRRITTTSRASGSGASYVIRNLTKPFKISINHDLIIHGGHNYPSVKNYEFYKAWLATGSSNYFEITSSDFVNRYCSDDEAITKIKKVEQSYTVKTPDGFVGKGDVITPFSLYSSSVGTGSVEDHITNILHDGYGHSAEVPMQGPFTEKYVGGMPHRHVFFPTSSITPNDPLRSEAWKVELKNYSDVGNPTQIRFVEVDAHRPKSYISRDGLAKRPVNIRNILQQTGSNEHLATIIGNYEKNYQVVQTSGRSVNPRYFVETNGLLSATVETSIFSGVIDYALPDRGRHSSIIVEKFSAPGGPEVMSRGFLDPVAEEFSVYNNLNNRNLVVRQPLQAVLTRHMGKFGYDSLIGNPFAATPVLSASYHKIPRNAAYKIVYSGALGTDRIGTASSYDNWYVQRPIPRSDLQYQWITASILYVTGVTVDPIQVKRLDGNAELLTSSVAFGYQKSNYTRVSSSYYGTWDASTDLVFASASDYGSRRDGATREFGSTYHQRSSNEFMPTDFVGLNYHIVEPITESLNHLGYPIDQLAPQGQLRTIGIAAGEFITDGPSTNPATPTPQEGTSSLFNALILNRNGPYHYPSWKQIRTGEHPVARHQRNNNLLDFVVDRPQEVFVDPLYPDNWTNPIGEEPSGHPSNPYAVGIGELNQSSSNKESYKSVFEDKRVKYKITPVTNKYKPMTHHLEQKSYEQQKMVQVSLRHTYGNNLNYWPISGGVLDFQLGIKRDPDQVLYDEITDEVKTFFYAPSPGAGGGIGPLKLQYGTKGSSRLKNLSYREVIFPREEHAYLGKVRGRQHYTESSGYGSESYDRTHGEHRTFWRANRADRRRTDVSTNSPGHGNAPPSGAINSMGTRIDEQILTNWTIAQIFGVGTDHTPDAKLAAHPACLRSNARREWNPSYLSMWPLDTQESGSDDHKYKGSGFLCGELYSNPYMTMTGSNYAAAQSSLGGTMTHIPTASQTFFFPNFWIHNRVYNSWGLDEPYHCTIGEVQMVASMDIGADPDTAVSGAMFKPQYSASAYSGKTPMFDSYDDWAADVRAMGQGYSIVPEFRISDHMEYYIDNSFKPVINNKFLSLDGGVFTSSADTEDGDSINSFYRTYSHSDFLKFVDIIKDDYIGSPESPETNKGVHGSFTLRCKAIKKLLPYNGFYPVNRCIQLGSLFSQSYAPHLNVIDGDTYVHKNEQIQSILQPTFAPGIMYNTIKSAIAVDWPGYTGSMPSAKGFARAAWLTQTASAAETEVYHNVRYPFETIIEPHKYFPDVGDDTAETKGTLDKRIIMISPPFEKTGSAITPKYTLYSGEYKSNYSMAANNFFGEIPRFFLEDGKFQSFKSKTGLFELLSGTTYFMDVTLNKSQKSDRQEDLIIYEGPDFAFTASHYDPIYDEEFDTAQFLGWNSAFPSGSARGIHFGPPCQVSNLSLYRAMNWQDPGFAPYTPPYFYGKSVARVQFSPHKHQDLLSARDLGAKHGEYGSFTIDEIINGARTETIYDPNDSEAWNLLKNYGAVHPDGNETAGKRRLYGNVADAAQEDRSLLGGSNAERAYLGRTGHESLAYKSRMRLDASIKLFGKIFEPEITWEPEVSPQGVPKWKPGGITYKKSEGAYNSWVISPKFETPVLNFSGNHEPFLTRGMWYGYGTEPKKGQGLYMKLRESHPHAVFKAMFGGATSQEAATHGIGTAISTLTDGSGQTGSLLQVLGFKEESGDLTRKLGQVANSKIISEAVVAVPYKPNQDFPFFPITRKRINDALEGKGSRATIDMVNKMQKYYFPPHMDFLTYDGKRIHPSPNSPFGDSVQPFAMYIFEFHHCLSKKDLIDIWQNLMPRIAEKAQKDESIITHTQDDSAGFFNIGDITSDTRWMIFKVKQKAQQSYYDVTADTYDDSRFKFDIGQSKVKPKYSYNWPYDFFSLVELVQIEAETTIKAPRKPGGN